MIKYLGQFKGYRKLNCIVKDMEQYISQLIDNLVFLDFYNFISQPLYTSALNLNSFQFVNHPLLQRKGLYTYEYMNKPKKFLKPLPHIETFCSSLTKESISEQDYDNAKNV